MEPWHTDVVASLYFVLNNLPLFAAATGVFVACRTEWATRPHVEICGWKWSWSSWLWQWCRRGTNAQQMHWILIGCDYSDASTCHQQYQTTPGGFSCTSCLQCRWKRPSVVRSLGVFVWIAGLDRTSMNFTNLDLTNITSRFFGVVLLCPLLWVTP